LQFEKTADHLFDAAYFNQEDAIVGVSESIISGVPMRLGTGFFDLISKSSSDHIIKERKPFFDDDTLHSEFKTDL
jgi:DNA-directed RNA polymerase III subunit RPC1